MKAISSKYSRSLGKGMVQYRPIRKVLLSTIVIMLALLVAELTARTLAPLPPEPLSYSRVIPTGDSRIGSFDDTMPPGQRLIGGFVGVYEPRIVSLQEIAGDQKRQGRITLLNFGDSSTSGWDGNIVAENARHLADGVLPKSPFHSFQTYSDILAQNDHLYVINAGVPGLTSTKATTYFTILVEELSLVGIRPDVVTVYLGNNDSSWNGNLEDKYYLSEASSTNLQLVRLFRQAASSFSIFSRTSLEDYVSNIQTISSAAKLAGMDVILIEPVVPRTWPPGLRGRGLEDELLAFIGQAEHTKAVQLLHDANTSFARGMASLRSGDVEVARSLLNTAKELDFVVPRIKSQYVRALHLLSTRENIPLVSISDVLPLDDSAYFCDYCHPIEPANRLISLRINEAVNDLRISHKRVR